MVGAFTAPTQAQRVKAERYRGREGGVGDWNELDWDAGYGGRNVKDHVRKDASSENSHRVGTGQLVDVSKKRSLLLVTSGHFGWVGIRTFLQNKWHWWVVGDVSRPESAQDAARKYHPDLILLAGDLADFPLPTMVTRLHDVSPVSNIVILNDDSEIAWTTLSKPGVRGYMCWSTVNEENIGVGLAAAATGWWIGSPMVLAEERGRRPQTQSRVVLTANETLVLSGLEAGLRPREIAEQKHMSIRTVERGVRTLERKLHAPTLYTLCARVKEEKLDEYVCVT